jgi:hypothetical protein
MEKMYHQFNWWLKAKWKLTLCSYIIVGRGLAGKHHIAFRNIESDREKLTNTAPGSPRALSDQR